MPYLRVGNTIYKKNPDGSRGEKVGTSKNPKRYLRALYAHETKEAGDWGLTDAQGAERGTLRTLFVGKLHHSMTTITDLLTQLGYLSQEENKLLTGLKGDLLKQFNENVPEELAGKSIQPDHLEAIANKSVSDVAPPNYMHGPGSLFGVVGMGSGRQKPKRGKKMAMKDFFDSFFGNKTKEKGDEGLGGFLVESEGEKHLPTSRNGKPDRALAGAAWAALFSPGGHRGKPYAGPNKEEAKKKLRALYEREGWDTPSSTKEASLSVTKGADGNWRWILFSSSIYQDRDQEIVSRAAQEADIAEMTTAKEYGTLDWWHVGTPTEDDPEPKYPLLALGDCDFAAMHNGIRVESGTFYDERLGDMVATHTKELSASLAFRHPMTQPDDNGVFSEAHTIERSILPTDHASNPLADVFTTKEKVMDQNKVKELTKLLGEGGDELVDKLLAVAEKRESIAQAMGVRSKEAAKKKDDEEAGEKKPDDEAGETVKEDEAGKSHTHKAMLHHHKEGEAGHYHSFEHSHKEAEAGHEHKNPMVDHGKHTEAMLKEAEAAKKKEGESEKKEAEGEAGKKKEGEAEAGKKEAAAKKEIVSTDPLVNIQLLMEKMCEKLDLIQLELEQAEDRAGEQEEPAAEALEEALVATKELKLKNDKEIAELKQAMGLVTKELKELKGDVPAAIRSRSAAAGDWTEAKRFLETLKAENEKTGTKETNSGPKTPDIVDFILKPVGQ